MKDLDAASEDDIRAFFNATTRPQCRVAYSGDLDVAQVKGLVDKYFGPIPAGPSLKQPPVPPIPAPTGERRIAMEAKVNLARGLMPGTRYPSLHPGTPNWICSPTCWAVARVRASIGAWCLS